MSQRGHAPNAVLPRTLAHRSAPTTGCALRCRCGKTILTLRGWVGRIPDKVTCPQCGTIWTTELYERPASIPPTSSQVEEADEYPNQSGIEAGHNVKAEGQP